MVKKSVAKGALSLLILALLAIFLIAPQRYAGSVFEGISLWAACVLPVTFPFLFLTALFTATPLFRKLSKGVSPFFMKVFGVSGTGGCAAFLAALSGYPVGARTLLDLREGGLVDASESFRLACLATTSGPAFFVGTVGGAMLSRPALGWLMLLCHLVAVWAVCALMRLIRKPAKLHRVPLVEIKRGGSLLESLSSSVLSILCVGGSIALFYAFGQMIADILPASVPPVGEAVVRGLVEMTTGCKLLCSQPTPFSLAICCFLVTFGGACVLFQQLGYLTRAGVKCLPFLLVKLLQALLAGGLCFGLSCLIF